MTTDLTATCLYCGVAHDLPLPCDCPGCGQRLGQTMGPDTTLLDLVKIAARSGRTVLLQVTPDVVPGVAGLLVSLDENLGWGEFLRHDGTAPMPEDYDAIERLDRATTPTPPTPGEE